MPRSLTTAASRKPVVYPKSSGRKTMYGRREERPVAENVYVKGTVVWLEREWSGASCLTVERGNIKIVAMSLKSTLRTARLK
jgi:hypothetical protein